MIGQRACRQQMVPIQLPAADSRQEGFRSAVRKSNRPATPERLERMDPCVTGFGSWKSARCNLAPAGILRSRPRFAPRPPWPPAVSNAHPRHEGLRFDRRRADFVTATAKRACTAGLILSLTLCFCAEVVGSGVFTYEKIHFTQDGSPTGTPLVPNFVWDSCWWALGNDDSGNIHVAISNHRSHPNGNVAIFKYDPVLNQMTFLNDLKSVSTAAANWLSTENQQKVHTRLIRGADGRLYFATHDNSWGSLTDHRGTHIYAIENGTITDLSKTATKHLNRAMQTVNANIGVHVENYGTIAMEMTRGTPRLLYGVTYGDGYLYRLNLETGDIKMIAQTGNGYAAGIIRNFAVDNSGNAYVPMRGTSTGDIRIYKYDNGADTWADTGRSYADGALAVGDYDKSGWRMHVYTKNSDRVYFISYDGRIYRFIFATEALDEMGVLEADPNPRVSDLILSDDEQHLYALIYRYNGINQNKFVEFDIQTGQVTTIDSDITIYGTRDLIYGGLARDKLGHAYMVGWTYANTSIGNIALFKINVEPAPSLAIRPMGVQVELDWNRGALQSAGDVAGPWIDVTNAMSPMVVQPLLSQEFFRLRL